MTWYWAVSFLALPHYVLWYVIIICTLTLPLMIILHPTISIHTLHPSSSTHSTVAYPFTNIFCISLLNTPYVSHLLIIITSSILYIYTDNIVIFFILALFLCYYIAIQCLVTDALSVNHFIFSVVLTVLLWISSTIYHASGASCETRLCSCCSLSERSLVGVKKTTCWKYISARDTLVCLVLKVVSHSSQATIVDYIRRISFRNIKVGGMS